MPEQDIEHLPVLLDGIVGQLGQFVIAQQEMHLVGIRVLELGNSSTRVCDMQPPPLG